jgi:hypothetical protein
MNPLESFNKRPGRPAGLRIYLAGMLVILAFATVGCSPITRADQPSITAAQLLEQDSVIGQSFISRYGGLDSVHFFLTPVQAGEGQIIFHLRSDSASTEDLGRAILPVQGVGAPGFYKFDFPTLGDSQLQYYYAYLEIEGDGQIEVGSGPADSYLEGALYQGHAPIEAQAAFSLGYQPGPLVIGLLKTSLQWIRTLLLGIFLFILPGWGLYSLLFPGWRNLSWPEKLALSGGLSLCVYPILFLWTHVVRLQLGAVMAWIPPLMGAVILLWRARAWKFTRTEHPVGIRFTGPAVRTWPRPSLHDLAWHHLAFAAVLGMVILTRFWSVRTLDIPLLGDSYQHSMITQLLVDNGGLFTSWQPYAELNTFTYHFGFHTAAAAYAWISGQATPQAVLWTGQILNILAVVSVYPLAVKLGRSPWAGVTAVLVAGLLAPMPMAYTNWGRYTQLAGQAVLPAAVYLVWVLMERKPAGRGTYVLGWILLGGLALIHYRILIFSLLFLPAVFVLYARDYGAKDMSRKISLVGLGAAVIFTPWFLRQFGGTILEIFASNISTPANRLPEATQQYNAIGDLTVYLPLLAWAGTGLAAAWGLLMRDKAAAVMITWWGLIVLATNPHWIGLPGAGSISNFAVAIAAYIPAGLLIGAAAGWAVQRFSPSSEGLSRTQAGPHPNRLLETALFLTVCTLALWGARQEIRYIDIPQHSLVTHADLRAASWIQENVPAEARFLVNSFFAYSGSAVVGSDAGWWLPLLAHRQTTLPPLSYGLEPEPWPGYRVYISDLTAVLQEKGLIHPDSLAVLQERGVSHVYIGQQQGRVNSIGAYAFQPEELLSSDYYQPIYHQDRVWVFELVGP